MESGAGAAGAAPAGGGAGMAAAAGGGSGAEAGAGQLAGTVRHRGWQRVAYSRPSSSPAAPIPAAGAAGLQPAGALRCRAGADAHVGCCFRDWRVPGLGFRVWGVSGLGFVVWGVQGWGLWFGASWSFCVEVLGVPASAFLSAPHAFHPAGCAFPHAVASIPCVHGHLPCWPSQAEMAFCGVRSQDHAPHNEFNTDPTHPLGECLADDAGTSARCARCA